LQIATAAGAWPEELGGKGLLSHRSGCHRGRAAARRLREQPRPRALEAG
jgi:hypothetical protein